MCVVNEIHEYEPRLWRFILIIFSLALWLWIRHEFPFPRCWLCPTCASAIAVTNVNAPERNWKQKHRVVKYYSVYSHHVPIHPKREAVSWNCNYSMKITWPPQHQCLRVEPQRQFDAAVASLTTHARRRGQSGRATCQLSAIDPVHTLPRRDVCVVQPEINAAALSPYVQHVSTDQ